MSEIVIFCRQHQWVAFVLLLVCAAMLAGCATAPGPTINLSPVCEALGSKITFNSHDKNSPWHAGPKLAPRLSHQNDVHDNLHCKE